jgi:FkbM family methyltransferase
MVFAAIVVIIGLVTKQPRRYWLFAGAAVATHLVVGVLFAGDGPITAWFGRATDDRTLKGFLGLGALALGWGVPIWLVVRGHEKRNVTLATRALRRTLAKRLLGPHVCAVIVESDNGKLAVGLEDYGVGWKLRKHGRYELDQINTLKKYVTEDSKVLVVGAHVGSFVVPISKGCKTVVAIEADPDTYRLLAANLVLNDVSNCRAINIAASDKHERIDFLVNRANTGGNKRVPKTKHPMYYDDRSAVISVDAFALDEYLDDLVFDVVLMDIEGSEYLALQGMKKILAHARVLVVEFLPHHLKNVSGVTVEEFLSVIPRRFRALTIPSKGRRVEAANFAAALNEMFTRDQGDDIIFEAA